MNDQQGCKPSTRIVQRLTQPFPLFTPFLLLYPSALLKTEPLRWKASPSDTQYRQTLFARDRGAGACSTSMRV